VGPSGCRYPRPARLVDGSRERTAMINSITRGTCLIVYFGGITKSRPDMRGVLFEVSAQCFHLTFPWRPRVAKFLRSEISSESTVKVESHRWEQLDLSKPQGLRIWLKREGLLSLAGARFYGDATS
jgi:hypothetical protein